ncbi:uncharacterized protein LOC131302935 [Rhododendron vialii]|uniref:uncharacterized protein LOC131302935 n=1 Tax=Rhododendron vialii TaxID=182163 RepID=UPI00265F52C9|nr:uncharacterized protein LOC131302935 [Rhododendron vialii]
MKKRLDETLRKYAEHYWQLFNEIPGVNQYWAARNFKNGLETGSKILYELAIRAHHGMNELMRTIEQLCSYEEFLAERELQGGQTSTVPQSLHVPTPQLAAPKPVVPAQPKKQPNPPKLNTEAGNDNSQKRCSYHNELGHYTTACALYKALLENLVALGLLDNHIDWTKTPRRQPNAGGPNPVPRPQ